MYLNRFNAILGYLFGRRRRPAPGFVRIRARVWLRCLLIAAAVLSARLAVASVAQTGNVFPVDNPFTLDVDEGIPDGNSWNIFEAVGHQTFFEGRHTDGTDLVDPTDDKNINFDITVGKTSSGTLLISGESALRDQALIIGDKGTLNGQPAFGTGTVRITGFGSVYNNNPYILPAEVENVPGFASETPRLKNVGFDAYVGRYGTGTLEITAGARGEIQDAVLVGDAAGATGHMNIDGIDSFLGSGGFDTQGGGGGSPYHQMILGRQGNGFMNITTGATVDSEASPAGGGQNTTGPIGAVLGSSPYSLTLGQIPDPGGDGQVAVTGAGSKWVVGGSLQVGGFDIGLAGATIGDVEGDNTIYGNQVGLGTLTVGDGGFVNVRNAIGVSPTDTTTSLLLAIGQKGTVKLAGGTIRIGNVTGQANQGTPDAVQVINDGVITGTGTINTGVFRNRYLGLVKVNPGDSLEINSSSDFASAGGATPSEPLINYGKIEVFGNANAQAQLEFKRSPSDPLNPLRPLINVPLLVPPAGAFSGGQISAQYANLRFGTGLENRSIVAFTAGTNNITGKVVNLFSGDTDEPDGDADDFTTQILVSGPGTTAVFHDDLSIGSTTSLNLVNGGNVVVLNQNSFTLAGNLGIELSYANPSLVNVVGNVGIGKATSELTVNLAGDVLHSLKHGDAFEIISFGGLIGDVDITNPSDPVPDLTKPPLFSVIRTSPDIKTLYGLDTLIEFSNQGVYAVFLDPTMIGSGAIAPDFNGDGVVNGLDFAIWQAHLGITSGASVLDGDADGDGDVDGADFLKWQRNVGQPMPWNGAGAGAGSGSGTGQLSAVPEPTGLALLVCGGSLALAVGRRRLKR